VAPAAPDGLALAIDTAGEEAGIALAEAGRPLGQVSWRTQRNQSRELLPAIDWLLRHLGRDKREVAALAVCLGPGSYAGLRVGLSTAKALAFGLEVPIAGVGRLAAEALAPAEASGRRVIALQAAGRAELAWAGYKWEDERLVEVSPPRLSRLEGVLAFLGPGDLVTGEVDRLDTAAKAALSARGSRLLGLSAPRAVSVLRLGLERLAAGDADDAQTLVPLYLRAPAIGPPPPDPR